MLKGVNRLLNNWNLKLMALVLAIALWGHVRGEVNPLETATFTVPLRATPPPGMTIANRAAVPRDVRVTVRAPRARLRELKGGVSLNPLAPPDEAPPLGEQFFQASLSFPVPKIGTASAPVKVDSRVEDAEVLGTKPTDVVVTLAAG